VCGDDAAFLSNYFDRLLLTVGTAVHELARLSSSALCIQILISFGRVGKFLSGAVLNDDHECSLNTGGH